MMVPANPEDAAAHRAWVPSERQSTKETEAMTDEAPKTEFVPAPEPTREERAAVLVAEFEHAHAHNAPVSFVMLAELRDLLGVAKPEPIEEAQGDQAPTGD
jgi:hypothetical protein